MSPKWYIAKLAGWPLGLLLGVQVIGKANVPKKGPLIVAANHRSFLDPPLVGFVLGRECFFMAKKPLFEIKKFFTWLITFYNALPVAGIETIRKARLVLEYGFALVIFPEGTRAKTDEMLSFHSGVGFMARKFQVPVLPVYIENSHKPIWQLLVRYRCLRVIIGKLIEPPPSVGSRESEEAFLADLREKIISLPQLAK